MKSNEEWSSQLVPLLVPCEKDLGKATYVIEKLIRGSHLEIVGFSIADMFGVFDLSTAFPTIVTAKALILFFMSL